MNDEKGKRIGVGTIRDTLMYAMFRAWQALGEHVSSIVLGLPFWIKTEPNWQTPFWFPHPTHPSCLAWRPVADNFEGPDGTGVCARAHCAVSRGGELLRMLEASQPELTGGPL